MWLLENVELHTWLTLHFDWTVLLLSVLSGSKGLRPDREANDPQTSVFISLVGNMLGRKNKRHRWYAQDY